MENLQYILEQIENILSNEQSFDKKVEYINEIRKITHKLSPFNNHPVDLVQWIKSTNVKANDYNPNEVAPPEMELLEISIINDWYTQPIVWWDEWENDITIIDWFHRHRVGKESVVVWKTLNWYLPIVNIRKSQQGKNDRIASTIRHNRARWKHKVDAMSEIVIELKNRNWKNERIARELWMDEEEVLRLLQISWLQEMFKDDDFSASWTSDWIWDEFGGIDDNLSIEEIEWVRTVNVDDENRIFHTYDKWECYKKWFYKTSVDWKTQDECENIFSDFFKKDWLFEEIWNKVIVEWKNSCEHYLTNNCMNRIARLWQACVCYHTGIPNKYSSGWFLLDKQTQQKANEVALKIINKWMATNNREEITMEKAMWWIDRQVNIY